MLALAAAFEQVSDADIELLNVVNIIAGEILGTENRDELSVGAQRRIGPQVGGDFLCLILKNQSARGFDGMVVRQRQVDGLIETDQRRILTTGSPREQEEDCCGGEHPKVPGAHKG